MSFYLKLLLIFSFAGQSIAVACVDTIAENYGARRTVFNVSSYEGKLEQTAPKINAYSSDNRTILIDEKKVDAGRQATDVEKAIIIKEVMAERLVAKKMKMTLGDKTTKDVNPYKDICIDSAKFGHFKVLELTWEFGDELASCHLAEINLQDHKEPNWSKYQDLFTLLGVTKEVFENWACGAICEHVGAIFPEKSTRIANVFFDHDYPEWLSAQKNIVKAVAEISSHPMAPTAVYNLAIELAKETVQCPKEIGFLNSALKEICSYYSVGWTKDLYSAKDIIDFIDSSGLSVMQDPDADIMSDISESDVEEAEKNKNLYRDALRLASGNIDGKKIAVSIFTPFARKNKSRFQYPAALQLQELSEELDGQEKAQAINAAVAGFSYFAQRDSGVSGIYDQFINDHTVFAAFALMALSKELSGAEKTKALYAAKVGLTRAAENNSHRNHVEAKELLEKLALEFVEFSTEDRLNIAAA